MLAWLVAGYRDWHEKGLNDPADVTDATDAYRAESDALGRFIEEQCLRKPACTVRSSALFAAWQRWADREGVTEPKTNKAFSAELENLGYDKNRTNTGAVWQGIGLIAGSDAP